MVSQDGDNHTMSFLFLSPERQRKGHLWKLEATSTEVPVTKQEDQQCFALCLYSVSSPFIKAEAVLMTVCVRLMNHFLINVSFSFTSLTILLLDNPDVATLVFTVTFADYTSKTFSLVRGQTCLCDSVHRSSLDRTRNYW